MDTGAYTLPHCKLQPSPSFFSPRALNTNTPSSASAAAPPYVTHLEQLSQTTLVAITSDGTANLIDKNTLRRIDGFQTAQQSGITNVGKLGGSSGGTIWGVTDRSGKCSVFDARSGSRNGLDQKMQIDSESTSDEALFHPSQYNPLTLFRLAHSPDILAATLPRLLVLIYTAPRSWSRTLLVRRTDIHLRSATDCCPCLDL